MALLFHAHAMLHASPALVILEGGRAPLSVETHLVLVSSFLKHTQSVQVLHGHQWLVEVVGLEVLVRVEAEDLLLFELPHQDFLHLLMRQFAVVVKPERLHVALGVLFELHFMLDYIHACFEDTFILDRLAYHDLAGASTFTLRWMCTGNLSRWI